jgi:hypothetical protein
MRQGKTPKRDAMLCQRGQEGWNKLEDVPKEEEDEGNEERAKTDI